MKPMHVNTWLDLKRESEPSIKESVRLWMLREFCSDGTQAQRVRAQVKEVQKVRRKNRKLAYVDDSVAPDGKPWDDGVRFNQISPREKQ